MSLVSHYDEQGNAIHIRHREEFMDSVWKQLALEAQKPAAESFDFATFMQTVYLAFGELKTTADVLNSISAKGPVAVMEVPAASAVPQKLQKTRPSLPSILQRLRGEADRLGRAVQDSQRIVTEHVLPLAKAGWRVAKINDRWEVDYGPAQLLGAVPPNSRTEHAVTIQPGEMLAMRLRDADEPLLLRIDDQHICGLPAEEPERSLFQRLLGLISANIFRTLLEAAGTRAIRDTDFGYTVHLPNDRAVKIALIPFEGAPSAAHPILKAFLQHADGKTLLSAL